MSYKIIITILNQVSSLAGITSDAWESPGARPPARAPDQPQSTR
jgi:hypothetical protein